MEHCFSVGNNCLQTNLDPENIVGKMVKETYSIGIDEQLLLQMKDAHVRYVKK